MNQLERRFLNDKPNGQKKSSKSQIDESIEPKLFQIHLNHQNQNHDFIDTNMMATNFTNTNNHKKYSVTEAYKQIKLDSV